MVVVSLVLPPILRGPYDIPAFIEASITWVVDDESCYDLLDEIP